MGLVNYIMKDCIICPLSYGPIPLLGNPQKLTGGLERDFLDVGISPGGMIEPAPMLRVRYTFHHPSGREPIPTPPPPPNPDQPPLRKNLSPLSPSKKSHMARNGGNSVAQPGRSGNNRYASCNLTVKGYLLPPAVVVPSSPMTLPSISLTGVRPPMVPVVNTSLAA